MVPSKIVSELNFFYETVKSQTITPHDYSGDDADIVFEIITAETFVAGIACTLLNLKSIKLNEKLILGNELMKNGEWLLENGGKFSLWHLTEVMEYAKNVEALRIACLKILNEKS